MRNVIGLVFGVLLLAGLVRAESAQEQGRVLDSFHQAAAAETPAAEEAVDPKPAGDCLRKRHKTNRKAGC